MVAGWKFKKKVTKAQSKKPEIFIKPSTLRGAPYSMTIFLSIDEDSNTSSEREDFCVPKANEGGVLLYCLTFKLFKTRMRPFLMI